MYISRLFLILKKRNKNIYPMSRNCTMRKGSYLLKGLVLFLRFISPSNDPDTQFGSTRIKTEARLVLADRPGPRARACLMARTRAHSLSTHRSLLAPWHTNLQTEPSVPNHFGARVQQMPVPVFVLRTLRSRTASTCAARACMDKQ